MAQFLDQSDIAQKLTKLIREADQFLYLVSPFVKLHLNILDELKNKKSQPSLHIEVVYGKNEDDPRRSMGDEQFELLAELPNIAIRHCPRLHAKIFCSEDAAIVGSLNLYDYSINNNIEAGVLLVSPTGNTKRREFGYPPDDEAYTEAIQFVKNNVIAHSELEYESKGKTKSTTSHYPKMGYCIRTGEPIPFDPERPMSWKAYKTWAQFSNPDYPEQYCHKTGKPSYGKTSMRRPVLG